MRFAILIFLVNLTAVANAVQIPRAMSFGANGLLSQGLGYGCFAFDLAADTLPCGPAVLAETRERAFRASVFFGNNVSYMKEATEFAKGEASSQTIETLFKRTDSSELDANLEAAFVSPTFGVAISPLRVNYFTTFRNPALPEVSLYASQEESAKLQFASYVGNDLFVGLQTRLLHRKFVARHFFLTDALAENGPQLFDPQQQSLLFLEPGIMFAPENPEWKPQLSLNLVNWGFADRSYEELPILPQYHLSGSIAPIVGLGRWGLGFDLFWDQNVKDVLEPVTLATYYEFGILRLFASLAENSQGAGFQVMSGPLNLGVTYSDQQTDDGLGEKARARRLFLLLGIEI